MLAEFKRRSVCHDCLAFVDGRSQVVAGVWSDNTIVLFGVNGSVLVKWQDSDEPHEKTFHRDFRIGRDDSCELRLNDPLISRRHAEVSFKEGLWWISDLGSRNGTTLDGRPVSRAQLPARCEVLLYETAPVLSIELRNPSTARTIADSTLVGH